MQFAIGVRASARTELIAVAGIVKGDILVLSLTVHANGVPTGILITAARRQRFKRQRRGIFQPDDTSVIGCFYIRESRYFVGETLVRIGLCNGSILAFQRIRDTIEYRCSTIVLAFVESGSKDRVGQRCFHLVGIGADFVNHRVC